MRCCLTAFFAHLLDNDVVDRAFVADHTSGFDAARDTSAGMTAARVANICGLPEDDVETFFRWFGETERVVTLYSQGINQSSSGTDKVNAIINCHLLTGRIGREGMGPFSLTGQPNAMGGREVGGLANQLAAHMEIGDPAHRALVQEFWRAPVIATTAGLKAIELVDAMEAGRVKAVWVMSTNPIVSLPEADRARAAFAKCDLVVVSDVIADTDTTRLAHVLLPATAWGEKDGTVTNSERRISRQRAFMAPPPDARPDWWQVCEVAKRMGFDGFAYSGPAAIFREHARLSAFRNAGSRDFDLAGLTAVSDGAYDALMPVQWPVPADGAGTPRLFASGGFFTPDRKARFIAVTPRAPVATTGQDFPLVLNTGRVRDQWHTMTRTGKAARLLRHIFEPYAEIHPVDAARAGIADGGLVTLATPFGNAVVRARIAAEQRQGNVFVPMHWTGTATSHGRINALVNAAVDPVSGQPGTETHAARNRALCAGLAGLCAHAGKSPRSQDSTGGRTAAQARAGDWSARRRVHRIRSKRSRENCFARRRGRGGSPIATRRSACIVSPACATGGWRASASSPPTIICRRANGCRVCSRRTGSTMWNARRSCWASRSTLARTSARSCVRASPSAASRSKPRSGAVRPMSTRSDGG